MEASRQELKRVLECNQETLKYGLSLTEFCDSQFIQSGDYADTLTRLQEIFYLYKNESMDELTDRELLEIMKENFEQICYGDLEYLETTCLERFAQAVRAGYRGYRGSGGENEYSQFDEETRWDKDLYMDVVKELFW